MKYNQRVKDYWLKDFASQSKYRQEEEMNAARTRLAIRILLVLPQRHDRSIPSMNSTNEAFSRVLIDKALEYSDWNLLDGKQVDFEYHNGVGRADYLLKDSLGLVLCVLEAKREDLDPYDAKDQARGYAANLKAPFVILSNGREHWFWNLKRANERDAYRIECRDDRPGSRRVRAVEVSDKRRA